MWNLRRKVDKLNAAKISYYVPIMGAVKAWHQRQSCPRERRLLCKERNLSLKLLTSYISSNTVQSAASNVCRAGFPLRSDFRLGSDFTPPLWRGKTIWVPNPECVCMCVFYTICVPMGVHIPPPSPPPSSLPILVVFWLVALKAFWSPWYYLGVSCGEDGQGGRTTLSRTHRHTTSVSDGCCVDNWSR